MKNIHRKILQGVQDSFFLEIKNTFLRLVSADPRAWVTLMMYDEDFLTKTRFPVSARLAIKTEKKVRT